MARDDQPQSAAQHGQRGVWFWHNALVCKALMQAGALDPAWEGFLWMGRAMGDLNGQGIPGEEINGGDHAMGIGALAGLALVESLLGLRVSGSRAWLRPRLPSALEGFRIEGLWLGGRTRSVHVQRRSAGPRVAAERRLGSEEALTFEV